MGIWNKIRVHRHDVVPISGGVSTTLDIKYDIRNTVSTTREIRYDVRQLVSDTLDILYDLKNLVSDTLEVKYTINGVVRNTLSLVWAIIAPSITASFKDSQESGEHLQTIDEMPPIPRSAIISTTGFHISAKLSVPEVTTLRTKSSLVVPNTIPVHAYSESLMKREAIGAIKASLKVKKEIAVRMESKFKHTQPVSAMRAEISFAPIYRIIQNNLILLQKNKMSFTIEEESQSWVYSESLFHFKEPSVVVGLVSYDDETQELNVFLNGVRYTYFDVPQRVYDMFEASPSKGAFFARFIRDQYNFKRN